MNSQSESTGVRSQANSNTTTSLSDWETSSLCLWLQSPTQPLLKQQCSAAQTNSLHRLTDRSKHVCNNRQYLLMQRLDASGVAGWLMAGD